MYVRIDPGFFKKERKTNYADWQSSFWRELFQNAIDQGATRIDINVQPGDECVDVQFADNGPGMTRHVLDDVYFAIGATTKNGGDKIGGMGRARMLTCFAMKSYQIHSQDYVVMGRGGYYDVQPSLRWTWGCDLRIEVDDTNVDIMLQKLNEFLGESNIAAAIYINGQRSTNDSGHVGRKVGYLSVELDSGSNQQFATVYVNKSAGQRRVLVRVNGVSMYSTDTSAKGQIIIELQPNLSREILTANRDGLRGNYRYAMSQFLRDLAVDTKTAVKDRFDRHTKVVHGGGMRKVKKPEAPKQPVVVAATDAADGYVAPSTVPHSDLYSDTKDIVTHAEPERDALGIWLAATFGDIYIFDETDNKAMHRVLPSYLPENWKLTTINKTRTFRKGGNILKVLLMWHTAVTYALEVALEPLGEKEIAYAVGFSFQDNGLADHRDRLDGHVFSLLPTDKNGKLAYAVSNRMSLKKLMSMAKHEVTHILHSWHDEEFATMREAIDMVFDDTECLRRMKTALDKMPDFDTAESSLAMAA